MLRAFHRDSARAEIAYRADFAAGIVLSLFWLTWAVLGLAVFYRFVDAILGWTFPEALAVLGMFFVVNGMRQFLVQPNLRQLADHVRFGTLDYLLLKPASVQFLVSFRRFNPVSWSDCGWGLVLTGVGVGMHRGMPGVADLLLFAVTLIAAVFTVYGIGMALMSLILWTVQWQGLDDLMRGLFEVGRFPVDFYGGVVATVFTVLFPVAVMTVFPAQALLGMLPATAAAGSLVAAALALIISAVVWRTAVRSYSGASS